MPKRHHDDRVTRGNYDGGRKLGKTSVHVPIASTLYDLHDGKLTLNLHPGQTQVWMCKKKYIFVVAGTQSGKCGRGDIMLAMPDGSRKKIKDIVPGDAVLSLGDNLKIKKSLVVNSFCTGVQGVYRVTTRTGREIEITAEHPLYSKDGFKPIEEMAVGDFIGVPRIIPIEGQREFSKKKLRLLGYLIGDGGLTCGTPIFTNTNERIVKDLERCLPRGVTLRKRGDSPSYGLSAGGGRSRTNPVTKLLRECGVDGELSKHKFVPDLVFTLRNEYVAEFLHALFTCDGWVDNRGVGYSSASKQLIYDVQHLLLRFGILSIVRYKRSKCGDKYFDSWSMHIADLDSMITFSERIGITLRQKKLDRLIEEKRGLRPNTKDVIPNFDKDACYSLCGYRHSKDGGYRDQEGYALLRGARRKSVARAFAQVLSDHFGIEHDKAYSDIYWDRIKSIEYLGKEPVYDLTIAGTHNFIANDIFAHNTSFVPFWLWNEILQTYIPGGDNDYLAATASWDLFKLKFLPEMIKVFERVLDIGRFWAADKIIELKCLDPNDPKYMTYYAKRATDPMWARIILRSAQSEGGLESTTARAAVLDECGQDGFSLQDFEAVQRRLSLAQGRILGATTPYNLGWLYTHVYRPWLDGDPDIEVINFPSYLNPAFSREEYERARAKMPAWRFAMFYDGKFERPAGLIYGDFNEDTMLVDPFPIPPDWEHVIGVDFGGANTATIYLAQDPATEIWYAFRETKSGHRTSASHATEHIENTRHVQSLEAVGGAMGETQQRDDWDAAGFPVSQPPVSDLESGISRVIELLKSGKFRVFRTLTNLRDEFSRYRRKLDDDGNATEDIVFKRSFHHLDALRYAATYITDEGGTDIISYADFIARTRVPA